MPRDKQEVNTNIQPYVCVVGGSIVDIVGYPKEKLKMSDSTPGNLKFSMGGVGRNIAENLMRLNVPVKLISALGDDFNAKQIKQHALEIGLDISDSLFLENTASSVHLGIMDEKNDMVLGITDIDINDKLDHDFIQTKIDLIDKAAITVIDTNLPEDTIRFIVKNCKNTIFCLDPISAVLTRKVNDFIGDFDIIKSNNIEAEAMTNTKIETEEDLVKVARIIHDRGVEKVIITLGKKGAFYSFKDLNNVLMPQKTEVINTNGAGDAFTAGVVFSELNGYTIDRCCKIGMACSAIAISHYDTVNPNMSEENLRAVLENSLNS